MSLPAKPLRGSDEYSQVYDAFDAQTLLFTTRSNLSKNTPQYYCAEAPLFVFFWRRNRHWAVACTSVNVVSPVTRGPIKAANGVHGPWKYSREGPSERERGSCLRGRWQRAVDRHHSFSAEFARSRSGSKARFWSSGRTRTRGHASPIRPRRDMGDRVTFSSARGLRLENVPPGLKVIVSGYRAKNRTPTARGGHLTLPDGRTLSLGSPEPGSPDNPK